MLFANWPIFVLYHIFYVFRSEKLEKHAIFSKIIILDVKKIENGIMDEKASASCFCLLHKILRITCIHTFVRFLGKKPLDVEGSLETLGG